MNRLQLILIIAVLQFLTSNTARGEQEMAWTGAGSASCAKFANYYKESPEVWENHFFTWAQGFMSGLNTAFLASQRNANLSPTSLAIAEQQLRLRLYCRSKMQRVASDAWSRFWFHCCHASTRVG